MGAFSRELSEVLEKALNTVEKDIQASEIEDILTLPDLQKIIVQIRDYR